jgi:hypothetical protein
VGLKRRKAVNDLRDARGRGHLSGVAPKQQATAMLRSSRKGCGRQSAAEKKWPSLGPGQWARISTMGNLPASATFPHARDAHKGRICATTLLFATTICCGLVLRRKLIFGQNSITMRPRCKALHRIRLDNTGGRAVALALRVSFLFRLFDGAHRSRGVIGEDQRS